MSVPTRCCVWEKWGHNLVESWRETNSVVVRNQLLLRIESNDGKPMEFECEIFPGLTTAGIFNEIQKLKSIHNSFEVGNNARKFPRGHWSFLGPRFEKTWYKTCIEKQSKTWEKITTSMFFSIGYNVWSPSISCLQSVGKMYEFTI